MAKVVNDPVIDSMNEVQNDIETEIEIKINNLKRAAATFLKQINAIQTKEKDDKLISTNQEDLKKLLETQSIQDLINNPKQILDKLMGYSATRKDGSEIMARIKRRTQILEYIFTFQKAINIFLNIGTITMTYVDDDGTLYEISEELEKEILRTSRFKGGKFIRVSLTEKLKKEINPQKTILEQHNEQVVKLYQKIMNKDNQISFANKDKNTKINNLLPVLYKNKRAITDTTFTTDFFLVTKRNRILTFNHINNLGILKEAYVDALFDENTKIKDSSNKSANILYDDYICHVDNLYGIFGGDVSVLQKDGTSSKDFAIKSGVFNSENYSQLILFANYILSQPSNNILKELGIQKNEKNMRTFFKDFTNQKIAEINGKLNTKAEDKVKEIFEKKGIMNIQFK